MQIGSDGGNPTEVSMQIGSNRDGQRAAPTEICTTGDHQRVESTKAHRDQAEGSSAVMGKPKEKGIAGGQGDMMWLMYPEIERVATVRANSMDWTGTKCLTERNIGVSPVPAAAVTCVRPSISVSVSVSVSASLSLYPSLCLSLYLPLSLPLLLALSLSLSLFLCFVYRDFSNVFSV